MTQVSTATDEEPAAVQEGATGGVEHGSPSDADGFDPIGTLALIAAYLAILVVMWVVMYFVEFAGNGPTVVG